MSCGKVCDQVVTLTAIDNQNRRGPHSVQDLGNVISMPLIPARTWRARPVDTKLL